jgi:hypothetical protein
LEDGAILDAASTIVAASTMLLFFFQRQLVESIKTPGLK